jgi:hypothetical protein
MKNGRSYCNLFWLLSFIILQSCDYGILYEVPQPGNSKNLDAFPVSIMGHYINDSSKNSLVILKNQVIKISNYDLAVSKNEIDTSKEGKLIGDSLYLSDMNEVIPVKIKNDSVFGIMPQRDTVFRISELNLLRKYKDDLFLNLQCSDSSWQVIRLTGLATGEIEFSIVNNKVDLEKLDRITKVQVVKDKSDSLINYKINPTRKEFLRLIKDGLFNQREIYRKNN